MRRHPKAIVAAISALLLTLALGVNLASADAPTVTIDAPGSVTYTSAHVSGTIDPNGGPSSIAYYFEYKTPDAGGWNAVQAGEISGAEAEGTDPIPVSGELTGLRAGTEYEVRLDAYVDGVETFSPEPHPTFTTDPVADPTATISPVGSVTASSAHFSGTINPNAPEAAPASAAVEAGYAVNWHFECNPECPGLAGGTVAADNIAHTVEADASGLKPHIAYEVSLVAENAGQSDSAGPEDFTTEAVGPGASTMPAFALEGGQEALVGGKVSAQNSATSYWVEYGTTSGYGQSTPVASAGSGEEPVTASQRIKGLSPQTTYHFRLVAENSKGTTHGDDLTFESTPSAEAQPGAGSCPNTAVRTEQRSAAFLPECRGYEQVSAPDKNGGAVDIRRGTSSGVTTHSPDGSAVVYPSYAAFAGAPSAYFNTYRAERTPSGWITTSVTPEQPENVASYGNGVKGSSGSSMDTSTVFFRAGVRLEPQDQNNNWDLFTWKKEGGVFERITRSNEGGVEGPVAGAGIPVVIGSDFGGSRVFFKGVRGLVHPTSGPEQVAGSNVYERVDGTTRLIGVDSSGALTSKCGASGPRRPSESGNNQDPRAVSFDGKSVAFVSPTPETFTDPSCSEATRLYVRLVDSDETVEASAPQRALGHPQGPILYQWRTRNGNHLFFSSEDQLTEEAAPTGGLYEYELSSRTLRLRLPLPAEAGSSVTVLGASEDGLTVYLQSILEPGTPLQVGLYVLKGGSMSLFAPISYDDSASLSELSPPMVAESGSQIAFLASSRLTSYDNAGFEELYLYDDRTETLSCASCRPDGQPASASVRFGVGNAENFPDRGNLTADGRVFFESPERLIAEDANDASDVYLYDEGRLKLLTRGDGSSLFIGASKSGDDAFFVSVNAVIPSDRDKAADVYDARVGGGLPEPPSIRSECVDDACQAPGSSPTLPERSGSAQYTGPADPIARKHGKHRHKKHQRRKRHRGKSQGHHHQRQTTRSHG